MNIYRIRNKGTGEFFKNTSGRTVWAREYTARDELKGYRFMKNFEEWRSQWEIVEYELEEVRVCS